VKEYLGRLQMPYQWLDLEMDDEAKKLVELTQPAQPRLPLLLFPTARVWSSPPSSSSQRRSGCRSAPTSRFTT